MDLIYTNASGEDVGVLDGFTLDLAFGSDENDFQLEVSIDSTAIEAGAFIYIDGTEYGGIVDGVEVDTESRLAKYLGRSFHGILNSRIIQPPAGSAYMTVSGEANAVIGKIIAAVGLGNLFEASTEDSTISIPSSKIDRYIPAYDGINKLLKHNDAKLAMTFRNGKIQLAAKAAVNYAENEQYSSDHYRFNVRKYSNKVNHLICLGAGSLTERQVLHLYLQEDGSIGNSPYFTGLDEYAAVYDYSAVESLEELEKGGRERLKELWNSDSAEMELFDDETVLDINDIVGATEEVTHTTITNRIVKKIIKIKDNATTIDYKVGD